MHTETQYKEFQQAYDYFNGELFMGVLRQVLITLQRKPRMLGHFAPARYEHRSSAEVIDEIALNPDEFPRQTDEEILSTLVHEMAHVWQQTCGQPGRRGYHNKQWGTCMREIGLHPSKTGRPNGSETGEQMSHYITPGGAFQLACRRLLDKGFKLDWQSHTHTWPRGVGVGGEEGEIVGHPDPKKKDRIKFTCRRCGSNAWGKPGLVLICGACHNCGKRSNTMKPAAA